MSESKNRSNDIGAVVSSLMEGAEAVLTSKTVVGQPVRVGDTIIIPLSDVTIGCGAGSNNSTGKDAGMGGFSAKMSPSAVLVIRDGTTKVVNIKDQTALTKLVDMIPGVVEKVKNRKDSGGVSDEDAVKAAFPDDAADTPETPVKEKK